MGDLFTEALAVLAGEPAALPAAHVEPWFGLQGPWGWGADQVRSPRPGETCRDCARPFRGNENVHVMPDRAPVHTGCAKQRLEAHGWQFPDSGPPVAPPGPPGPAAPSLGQPTPLEAL